MKKVLVTGMAGFIGFHLTRRLAQEGYAVIGLDNLNAYYDPRLKINRINVLGISEQSIVCHNFVQSTIYSNLQFIKADLADKSFVDELFATECFDYVFHLAAQPGIRASISNPYAYLRDNIEAFLNVLEACRHKPVKHLVYASSSSVYGSSDKLPNLEKDKVSTPLSLYAATKLSNELMAHAYSHSYGIPCTGLRFFTVYGPWGRPDMAYYKFAHAIARGHAIEVYNSGQLERDFTFVDDIVESMYRLMAKPPHFQPPCAIYNIGKGTPIRLTNFISMLEQLIGKSAIKTMLPMQQGDVIATQADCSQLESIVGFVPATPLETGLKAFVEWFLEYEAQQKSTAAAALPCLKE